MKIVYLQYTGHFVEAYRSVFEKGSELYYGQEYCLKIKAGQAQQGHSVTAIQYFEEAYDELLAPNLRAIALGHEGNNNYARLLALVNDIRPDRVIMCFPDAGILRFLRKNKTPVILALADSFESIKWYRIRSQLKLALLKRELRHPHIKWISNHQLNASRSLIKFGIPEGKIIPYDWEHKENENLSPLLDVRTLALLTRPIIVTCFPLNCGISAMLQVRKASTSSRYSSSG